MNWVTQNCMSISLNTCKGRIASVAVAAALALGVAPWPVAAQTAPSAAEPRTLVDQGVTVTVTPKALGSPDVRWEFSVVFDTHSAQLNDDVAQTTVLVTNDGRTLKPAAWTGAGPGGHHREGVLVFEAPVPRPASIELKMTRPGEPAVRIFRWQL